MVSISRADCLRSLSAQLGFAYRKALPILSSKDRPRFLSSIADMLVDIGEDLKPKVHTIARRLAFATVEIKQEVSRSCALASRSNDEVVQEVIPEVVPEAFDFGANSNVEVLDWHEDFVDTEGGCPPPIQDSSGAD